MVAAICFSARARKYTSKGRSTMPVELGYFTLKVKDVARA
jgi:hypothetical protein